MLLKGGMQDTHDGSKRHRCRSHDEAGTLLLELLRAYALGQQTEDNLVQNDCNDDVEAYNHKQSQYDGAVPVRFVFLRCVLVYYCLCRF